MPRALILLIASLFILPSPASAAEPASGAAAPVGTVELVRNQVIGVPPMGTAALLATGDPLVLRHRVDTQVDSGARLAVGEGCRISLGASTSITLDELVLKEARAGRSRVSILLGTLRLKLTKLFRGELDVATPTAVIGVKGTELEIEVSEGLTVVTVLEGVVTVRGRSPSGEASGDPVEVEAGERTRVERGKRPSRPEKASSLPQRDPALGTPASPTAPPPAPAPSPSPTPTRPPGSPPPSVPPPTTPQSAPGAPGTPSVPPSTPPPGTVAACSARGQAGEVVCVCGNFAGAGPLTVDGRPVEVVSVEADRVIVRLPEDLKAGDHLLSVASPRGRATAAVPSAGCRISVLVVEAEYEEPLKQGRATQLILRVIGSSEKVRLRVRNLSPKIVRLKGGADQVVTTKGGRRNTARIRVSTIGDGLAHIRAQALDITTCPCGGGLP